MRHFVFLLIATGVVLSPSARADFDFMGGLGIHEGGDDIVTANFTDGSVETIQAGEFVALDAGVAWDMGILEARITAGIRYDTITADNGKLDFTRYTATGLLMIAVGDWRFGGGSTLHFNIKLNGEGVGSSNTSSFDDAIGAVAEIDYYFNPRAYFGVVYTRIEYDRTSDFGQTPQTFDASSIGLVLVGRW